MGCCISNPRRDHDDGHNPPTSHRSPPPEEKETVKELVLSEIPFHAPKVTDSPPSPPELQQKEISPAVKEEEPAAGHREDPGLQLQVDTTSELSEICSVAGGSSSTSTTNTSTVENDDVISREFRDVVDVRRRVVPVHSPATVKSTVPKPKKNPPVIRSNVSGWGRGQRQNAVGARRSDLGGGLRPVSSRRSISPANGRSPARRGGNGWDREVNERGETRKTKVALIDGGDLKRPSPADETLDNPLMSLECFIFL